jgi:aminopeptidase N
MKRLIFYILICSISTNLFSQNYSKGDSLRGNLSSLRNCYDVFFYDLDIHLDLEKKTLEESSNTLYFIAVNDFNKIQIDLFKHLKINSIEFEGSLLEFSREYDAVFVKFPRLILEGEKIKIKCKYFGVPQEAKNPPWDGGFSWSKDDNNNDWVGVSCQGLGASSWWPCKDHQSDEPDSMKITFTINKNLPIISNGNLISDSTFINRDNKKSRVSAWFVSYPINNYNVTLNIGDYINFKDKYISKEDTLDLDYYVLSYNKEKAYKHFQQVKPMLKCFEFYFGQYPFFNDGYALVETSYLGMEHQSAIAYGNNYLPGYRGNTKYISDLDFDFIIVHETGHEWWGNSITSNDIADMWVHEGFCTYSEVLYVECRMAMIKC